MLLGNLTMGLFALGASKQQRLVAFACQNQSPNWRLVGSVTDSVCALRPNTYLSYIYSLVTIKP